MGNHIQWDTGLNGFKKHELIGNTFTTLITDQNFEPDRNIDDIFYDHLSKRNGKVELLYSGGLDSELVLASLLRNKIPVEAMTLAIKIKDAIINVVDLYYSEKFCRQNNVKQNIFYLDGTEFYNSGQYLQYLMPFNITEPHVASHFWLIDKCINFPVIGGDWPWVQVHRKEKVLSPFKLAFSSYERYMQKNKIDGIGNMISHSYESCHYFMQRQIQEYNPSHVSLRTVPFMKYKMYSLQEPRIKSYGWEDCPKEIFDIDLHRKILVKLLGEAKSNIIWQNKTMQLLNTSITENTSFV